MDDKIKQKYIIGKEKLEEIIQARKQTKDKREDRRFQVIELRILGHSNEEIASITQASLRAVILWIKGYTEYGIDALRNKKRVGNHRNLTFEEEAELLKEFEEKAQQGNMDNINVFLQEMSKEYPQDILLLICDGAIWHRSSTLNIPSHIIIIHIPLYTPEMDPIKQVWKQI